MKLKKLKLNEISRTRLEESEMCRLLGGGTPGNCTCGCLYANSGGSSTASNDAANNASGLTSYGYSGGDTENYYQTPQGIGCTLLPPPPQKDCFCAAQSTLCPSTQPTCWV